MTDYNPSGLTRALALAGPALALLFTVFALTTGTGVGLGGVWFCAMVWTLLTAFAGILWRGFRYGDWSAISRYELPEENGERFDWSTRTGRYVHLRDLEEQELHGHD